MNEQTLHLIKDASLAYESGKLEHAKQKALQALTMLIPDSRYDHITQFKDSSLISPCLNILTLLQSIASRQHDLVSYEKYEAPVKELMFHMFGKESGSYYAVHLIDACECYLSAGDIVTAQWLLEDAMRLMEEANGSCPLIDFLHAHYNAKLHFHMEQYYECIGECLNANTFWLAEPILPPVATDFLKHYAENTGLIDKLGCSNLILISCAYGKINNNEEGINILSTLRETPPEDYYLCASMDLTLAELYARSGRYAEARNICVSYLTQDLSGYPDMLSSLATLSFVLGLPSGTLTHTLFTAGNDGELPASFCYSRDAFRILLYNHGLTLVGKGEYQEALSLYHNLGDIGISLRIVLLAKTGDYKAIPECKKTADRYYARQIDSLFLYYNEKYVYNHLSMLEYHFALCTDAYLSCYEALGRESMTPESIYDFVLNTKYISLEASYLSHHYRTLDALKNRSSVTGRDVMGFLPEDTVLLEFHMSRTLSTQDYCVFLVTCNEVFCVRLGDRLALDELIREWRRLYIDSAYAAPIDEDGIAKQRKDRRELDTKLRRILYRPIRELLADLSGESSINKLIISPAGALIHFPFSRLSISASRYLGNDYEVTYVNTGKELVVCNTDTVDTDAIYSTDQSDPYSFEHNDMQTGGDSDWQIDMHNTITNVMFSNPLIIGNPTTSSYPPLPYAEKEAYMVAEYLHTACYTGENASISLFDFNTYRTPTLMHVAAHGVFKELKKEKFDVGTESLSSSSADIPDWNNAFDVMEHSGLVLTDDTLLSCNQISAMNLASVRLAVLSACRTGKGIFHSSEGVYGLRRALKLAGCQAMIISLWQIDDRSGYYFMQAFYENLVKMPENPKHAFFLAVDTLRSYEENNIRPFDEPYYWAGYVYVE